jgi:hypothetical protein
MKPEFFNNDTCSTNLERVRYYARQLVDANTLTTDQQHTLQKARQHNRMLHGSGVVCGLQIMPSPTDKHPWHITIYPGYALSPQGDAIYVNTPVDFDLATGVQTSQDPCANAMPCPPVGQTTSHGDDNRFVYLTARYTECYSRPERVPSAGCGCDETACEYARIRESFELQLTNEMPESHLRAAAADEEWCKEVRRWVRSDIPGPAPVPPCPECSDDPRVVVARINLPQQAETPISERNISYQGRRVLYSVSTLHILARCSV